MDHEAAGLICAGSVCEDQGNTGVIARRCRIGDRGHMLGRRHIDADSLNHLRSKSRRVYLRDSKSIWVIADQREGMPLLAHRQTRSPRHRPAFQHGVEFEPQVITQSPRRFCTTNAPAAWPPGFGGGSGIRVKSRLGTYSINGLFRAPVFAVFECGAKVDDLRKPNWRVGFRNISRRAWHG